MAIPMMLANYYPSGLLGLGITALLASFMSGMAGNVTAFNTVWTYDIYQSYLNPAAGDRHYLWMGRVATVVGVGLAVATAYLVTRFNNLMDLLQLVFAFINAPLFGTFLAGMFWSRATGHGAFIGLVGGTVGAALHHGLTHVAQVPIGVSGGGWIAQLHTYPSPMAQNFWTAITSFAVCVLLTVLISVVTRPRPTGELVGLVYSLTPRVVDAERAWYRRPAALAVIVLVATLVLNLLFR
jgi:SSS family solute:Na+ symporter